MFPKTVLIWLDPNGFTTSRIDFLGSPLSTTVAAGTARLATHEAKTRPWGFFGPATIRSSKTILGISPIEMMKNGNLYELVVSWEYRCWNPGHHGRKRSTMVYSAMPSWARALTILTGPRWFGRVPWIPLVLYAKAESHRWWPSLYIDEFRPSMSCTLMI